MRFKNQFAEVDYPNESYHEEIEVVVMRMTYFSIVNYSYLVINKTSKQSIIVDPAWNMEKVDQALKDSGVALAGILITHSHPDHIHLADPLAEKYNCPIWMSNKEIEYSGYNVSKLKGIDPKPFEVGGISIRPIYTPGHTPGSMCFLIGNNLFSGDTLFAEGCGMCHDTKGAYDMFESLDFLKNQLRPETFVYPGHSYGRPPGQLLSYVIRNNIYIQFKNKEDFAAYRLRKGQNKLGFFDFR